MRRTLTAITLATALGFAASPARAGGFLVYDLSGEAIGRASAVSAETREPSANWFNPAALAYLEGTNVAAGSVLITARSYFTAADSGTQTSSERGTFVLPTLYAQTKLGERIALGLGIYSAFGIGIEWPDAWHGRESAISASLQTVSFNPNVAVSADEHWSFAAGFDAIRSTVDFQNGLPSIVGGKVRLVGDAWGYGFNVAALYRPLPERLHFALTYRSRVKLSYDGQADFQAGNPDFARALPDQPGQAAITLPDIITAGVIGRPTRALSLGFDVNAVLWSTYDHIPIDFSSAPDRTLNPQGKTALTFRGGVDVALPLGFHARGGLIYDQGATPAQGISPALPDSDRFDLAAGLGYERGFLKADLGYMLVLFLPVDAQGGVESPEGRYVTHAELFGLTVGAHF
ncbi:MAG TPA: outer membrane protein transport protein [Polyangiaceae bacterium]|nr:outer membrane protein transport protein [Polyangiaceae bacterium]